MPPETERVSHASMYGRKYIALCRSRRCRLSSCRLRTCRKLQVIRRLRSMLSWETTKGKRKTTTTTTAGALKPKTYESIKWITVRNFNFSSRNLHPVEEIGGERASQPASQGTNGPASDRSTRTTTSSIQIKQTRGVTRSRPIELYILFMHAHKGGFEHAPFLYHIHFYVRMRVSCNTNRRNTEMASLLYSRTFHYFRRFLPTAHRIHFRAPCALPHQRPAEVG